MNIYQHPACTAFIGAPSDMQDGSCDALPVAIQTDEHGTWSVSFWKPEPAELARLNAGGAVSLHVRAHGRQHPVVAVGAQAPVPGEPAPSVRTLRDEFAIAALATSLNAAELQRLTHVDRAAWCYAQADPMLEARNANR